MTVIHVALKCYSGIDISSQYQKFALLLCASEMSLQCGNRDGCIEYAEKAAQIALPDAHLFLAHLLLCRAYASCGDFANLEKEYARCLELKTDCNIGRVCQNLIEYQCGVRNGSELKLTEGTEMWMAISYLVEGLISLWKQDFVAAERRGCALAGGESCLQLCHGVSCLEVAKQESEQSGESFSDSSAVRIGVGSKASFVSNGTLGPRR